MILLDVVVKFEDNKSIFLEMLPEFVAALVAFFLGVGYNNHIRSEERKQNILDMMSAKAEQERINRNVLVNNLSLAAENYFLVRIEREKALENIKTYEVLAHYSVAENAERNKRMMHEYILREQEIKMQCHSYHAEMRSLAGQLYPGIENKNTLDLLVNAIQDFASAVTYEFKKWKKEEFYTNDDHADKSREEYSNLVLNTLNIKLKKIQDIIFKQP
jgi:hypothetical protein